MDGVEGYYASEHRALARIGELLTLWDIPVMLRVDPLSYPQVPRMRMYRKTGLLLLRGRAFVETADVGWSLSWWCIWCQVADECDGDSPDWVWVDEERPVDEVAAQIAYAVRRKAEAEPWRIRAACPAMADPGGRDYLCSSFCEAEYADRPEHACPACEVELNVEPVHWFEDEWPDGFWWDEDGVEFVRLAAARRVPVDTR